MGGFMKVHYLQHVPFEGLGSMELWLNKAGVVISRTRLFEDDLLPDSSDLDFLIVLGGPMSVNDIDKYPWLVEEKRFIRNMILEGKPVLGICLGAQLIAHSMGGDVFPNRVKEIGWFPIRGVKPVEEGVFQFPESVEVFHWHGETFSLPEGAVLLAQSEGCKNQAFQIGKKVLGLQFHLETTPRSARALVENCRDELVSAEYIQTEDRILSESSDHFDLINGLMGDVLESLIYTE